jgi:hypothetical protein
VCVSQSVTVRGIQLKRNTLFMTKPQNCNSHFFYLLCAWTHFQILQPEIAWLHFDTSSHNTMNEKKNKNFFFASFWHVAINARTNFLFSIITTLCFYFDGLIVQSKDSRHSLKIIRYRKSIFTHTKRSN